MMKDRVRDTEKLLSAQKYVTDRQEFERMAQEKLGLSAEEWEKK